MTPVKPASVHDGRVGALVTLDLPADSPVLDMPWIIRFGPLDDDEEWEPVVCGPYERPHALALAEAVVADEELMAIVEPLQPHVSIDQIRGDIAAARLAAEAEADEDDDEFDDDEFEEFEDDEDDDEEEDDEFDDEDELDEDELDEEELDEEDEEEGEGTVRAEVLDEDEDVEYVEPSPPPTPEEVRAGFGRIAARLTG
jgi:hypothetical protein